MFCHVFQHINFLYAYYVTVTVQGTCCDWYYHSWCDDTL